MTGTVKTIVIAGLTFIAGFAAGYFTHKKMNDVQFQEVSEEEMAEIEKVIEKGKAQEKDISIKKENTKKDEDLPTDPDELRKTLQGKVSYIRADHEAKQKYEEIWSTVRSYSNEENADQIPLDPSDMEEGLDEEFLEMIEKEEVEPGQVEPPHIITLAEFYNDYPDFDKITIDWYEEDNTFLDEREEVITDIRTYIGMDIQELFRQKTEDDDPDVRFVKNEQYGSCYEIIRHHGKLKGR